jgi:hypothetical protein
LLLLVVDNKSFFVGKLDGCQNEIAIHHSQSLIKKLADG